MLATRDDDRRHLAFFIGCRAERAVHHIRDQEGGTTSLLRIGQVLQRRVDIRAGMLGLEGQQLADDMQHMALTFLGRDEFLHLVAKEDHTDLVVVLDRGESEGGGYFGHRVAFHLAHRTKITATADIDEQHHR